MTQKERMEQGIIYDPGASEIADEQAVIWKDCEYPIDSVASVRTGQETEMKESTGRI